ncbi:MAG: hypothetical protein UZ16_OP3001000868 [Candidatus Hinthialibacteria bacterium OLB16]|nr:MAG: hypothetical protein UZ16_OP3001000868 [Candidatus Hinthialibacteria bacterium OLB16]
MPPELCCPFADPISRDPNLMMEVVHRHDQVQRKTLGDSQHVGGLAEPDTVTGRRAVSQTFSELILPTVQVAGMRTLDTHKGQAILPALNCKVGIRKQAISSTFWNLIPEMFAIVISPDRQDPIRELEGSKEFIQQSMDNLVVGAMGGFDVACHKENVGPVFSKNVLNPFFECPDFFEMQAANQGQAVGIKRGGK